MAEFWLHNECVLPLKFCPVLICAWFSWIYFVCMREKPAYYSASQSKLHMQQAQTIKVYLPVRTLQTLLLKERKMSYRCGSTSGQDLFLIFWSLFWFGSMEWAERTSVPDFCCTIQWYECLSTTTMPITCHVWIGFHDLAWMSLRTAVTEIHHCWHVLAWTWTVTLIACHVKVISIWLMVQNTI